MFYKHNHQFKKLRFSNVKYTTLENPHAAILPGVKTYFYSREYRDF